MSVTRHSPFFIFQFSPLAFPIPASPLSLTYWRAGLPPLFKIFSDVGEGLTARLPHILVAAEHQAGHAVVGGTGKPRRLATRVGDVLREVFNEHIVVQRQRLAVITTLGTERGEGKTLGCTLARCATLIADFCLVFLAEARHLVAVDRPYATVSHLRHLLKPLLFVVHIFTFLSLIRRWRQMQI